MKIDKEYPATHSMDTAWFATDLDGNVAIFQFEEDGPGPMPFTDMHTDELLFVLGEVRDKVSVLPFSEEQINELKAGLKPVRYADEIRYKCNIMLTPNSLHNILRIGARIDLCYSEKDNFYHIEYWEDFDKNKILIEDFIKQGHVLGIQECDVEIYFEDDREDTSEHRLKKFPFFVYEQKFCSSAPHRMVVPKYPMKAEQMPEITKEYTLHLPVRFSEKEHVEPAEFVDSWCWQYNNHVKKVDGITYMQVALTDGRYGYVKLKNDFLENKKTENKKWDAAPRVIDISDEYIEDE